MKILKFIETYSQQLAAASCIGVIGAAAYPPTLGLSTLREAFAFYRNGEEQALRPQVDELAEKVLSRIQMSESELQSISFFKCFGMDPLHQGTTKSKTGAIIGIPASYEFSTKEDVINSGIKARDKAIDWDTPDGKILQESFMMSYKAKAFGIAREINYANTWYLHIDTLLKSICLGGAYVVSYMAKRGFMKRAKFSAGLRGTGYALITTFAGCLYITLTDQYYCWRDNSVDRKTAQIGIAYAEGGKEYYEKRLQRNVALRNILGDEGRSHFTAYGNEKSVIHDSHVNFTIRRDNITRLFNEMLEKYDGDKE